ncbi:MAG: TonB-dependent copper receptor [Opitutaceae bacterium]|jgi:iron complex outermembrane receptor protein|nr:TonB-dependent copper receptor [Opitutaceae bacterium]
MRNPPLHRRLMPVLALAAWTATAGVALALNTANADNADAAGVTRLAPVVITGAASDGTPLQVTLDTRSAARPGPAQDGADIIRFVPGVVISRKGGTGGEIILRGAGGSRLSILEDPESILGGCPNRMDPPGAYIFPGDFESVTVVKGPSAVRHGPGNSAGVVLFKNAVPRFDAPGARLDASAGAGSAGRNDQSVSATAGAPGFYVKAEGARTAADDYRDGNGNKVHSRYTRHGGRLALGWTPDANTVLEAHGSIAGGEAAYAHGMMDAARLDRLGGGLRFEKKKISALVGTVEAGLFYNFADHVMDDYSLRAPEPMVMMGNTSYMAASNVSHRNFGGRALVTLAPAEESALTLGADFRFSSHDKRSDSRYTVGSTTHVNQGSYKNAARMKDAEYGGIGAFAEFSRDFGKQNRLHAGARLDSWAAKDKRAPASSATGGGDRDELLPAGFVRYERDLGAVRGLTLYANLGRTERAPDYWELFSYQSAATNSSFNTRPEKTTQLDIGGEWKHNALTLRAALFAGSVNDFILVDTRAPALAGMGVRSVARNIDASTLGGELGAGCALDAAGGQWQFDASLAHVRGRNRTDARALPQIPPLEGRVAAGYARGKFSAGVSSRLVARQTRHDTGRGGVTGADLGGTAGFAVLSLNAGWRVTDWAELSAGVDNLLDRAYAEHVSRAGSGYPGYIANVRVNEPGRSLWAKLRLRF